MQQRSTLGADAPGPAADATPSVDVVLLTTDEKLLATLREASTEYHELWHAESTDAALDLLVGGHCGILVADLALFEGDAAVFLGRLQTQFPELIILATGRREEEVTVAEAISSGCIYRFLHKPVSPARATLFLGTATRRYGELREVEALALATVRLAASRPRFSKLTIGIVALLVSGGVAGWFASNRTPATEASTEQLSPVDDYLLRAQTAFKAGRLSDATNDNALAWYRTALAAAPDNEAARAGIERVIAALDKRTVIELRRGDVTGATAALAELERAHPAHPHLAGLQRQLRALTTPVAKTTVATAPAVRAAPPLPTTPAPAALSEPAVSTSPAADAPAPAPVATDKVSAPTVVQEPTPQIDRARARLAASQLIAPVDDSAAAYLRKAREAGEDETRLKITATDLAARILQQAQENLVTGNLPDSRADYEAAAALDKEFELALPELEGVAQRLASALLDRARTAMASEQMKEARELAEAAVKLQPGASSGARMLQQIEAASPSAKQ